MQSIENAERPSDFGIRGIIGRKIERDNTLGSRELNRDREVGNVAEIADKNSRHSNRVSEELNSLDDDYESALDKENKELAFDYVKEFANALEI